MEKIVDVKFFGNFKKKSQKWPTQDLSNIERNKVMKNQPIQGIPRGLAYNNQPGGVDLTPPIDYFSPILVECSKWADFS